MRIMGIRTTGSAVKNHISSEMAQLHLHLLLHHGIPFLMSTDTPKIQYQKEVEVRVKSFEKTRCMNPQKPKQK